jgi:uncharacterized protein involved in type VI secretion and phage assembly
MEEAVLEKTLTRLIEKVDHKYYGKYRGIVVDNNDPEKLGRLKVKVPSVLGNDVVTGWAMPCLPYGGAADQGFFFIPEVNAGVWVEFEAGDLEYPIWVGTYWAKPGGETEVPKPADTQEPPTSKIIKTVKGHTIEISDADEKEFIKIIDGVNGNAITLDKNGVTIKSDKIKIGEGATTEKLVLGTTLEKLLKTWHDLIANHTHTGNLGAPTTPPTPPIAPAVPQLASALSDKHFTEK